MLVKNVSYIFNRVRKRGIEKEGGKEIPQSLTDSPTKYQRARAEPGAQYSIVISQTGEGTHEHVTPCSAFPVGSWITSSILDFKGHLAPRGLLSCGWSEAESLTFP